MRTPPGQWSTVILPLNRLLLTGQGQIRDVQRKWDKGMELRSLGFTIADGAGGPFRLDVAWVSLVPEVREHSKSNGWARRWSRLDRRWKESGGDGWAWLGCRLGRRWRGCGG